MRGDYPGDRVMKVTLATHGGQAAAMRLHLPARVVDSNALPQTAADELARLVAAAKSAPAQTAELPGRARDAMSYTITVDDDGSPVILRASDTTISPAFDALLRWIEQHSAGK
jgi:Emfourin